MLLLLKTIDYFPANNITSSLSYWFLSLWESVVWHISTPRKLKSWGHRWFSTLHTWIGRLGLDGDQNCYWVVWIVVPGRLSSTTPWLVCDTFLTAMHNSFCQFTRSDRRSRKYLPAQYQIGICTLLHHISLFWHWEARAGKVWWSKESTTRLL